MSGVVAALIVLAASGAPADSGPTHVDEIELFAKTMAIAKTAKTSCPDLDVDDRFLEALRRRLHVVEVDHSAFAPVARTAVDALLRARDAAPNRQAWCDAVFRLYGPDGKLMRGCFIGKLGRTTQGLLLGTSTAAHCFRCGPPVARSVHSRRSR